MTNPLEPRVNAIDKWAERIYVETDLGRSVATTGAGIVGLVIYIAFDDWVIAVFSTIISFPVFRLISSWLHEKVSRDKHRRIEKEEAEILYKNLSQGEKDVVQAFVDAEGCVLTWSKTNKMSLRIESIESLIQRGVLFTSVTADGMTETFVLETSVFDIGKSYAEK